MNNEQLITRGDVIPALYSENADVFIRKYIAPKAALKDLKEIQVQLNVLDFDFRDVLKKRCYVVPYWDENTSSYRYQVLTAYHEKLSRADQTGLLDGIEIISDAQNNKNPTWAEAKVYKKDCGHPFSIRVFWSEYVCLKKDGSPNKMWKTKSDMMLKKVAVSRALDLAFAAPLMGLMIPEEVNEITDIEFQELKGDDLTEEQVEKMKADAVLKETELKQQEIDKDETDFLKKCQAAKDWLKQNTNSDETYNQLLGGQWGVEKEIEIEIKKREMFIGNLKNIVEDKRKDNKGKTKQEKLL